MDTYVENQTEEDVDYSVPSHRDRHRLPKTREARIPDGTTQVIFYHIENGPRIARSRRLTSDDERVILTKIASDGIIVKTRQPPFFETTGERQVRGFIPVDLSEFNEL